MWPAGRRGTATRMVNVDLVSVVAVFAAIAVQGGVMPPWQAASLVGGGVLTMLVYPTLGLRRLGR